MRRVLKRLKINTKGDVFIVPASTVVIFVGLSFFYYQNNFSEESQKYWRTSYNGLEGDKRAGKGWDEYRLTQQVASIFNG